MALTEREPNRVQAHGDPYDSCMADAIGKKLEAIERHLDVAGRILWEKRGHTISAKGPRTALVPSTPWAKQAFILAEELLGETGNIRPVT